MQREGVLFHLDGMASVSKQRDQRRPGRTWSVTCTHRLRLRRDLP